MKLIKTINIVQTRSKFMEGLTAETIANLKEEQESLNVEVSRDPEEKAALIFQCFSRKTSVIYDIQSLCEILKKDLSAFQEEGAEFDEATLEIVANMIY